MAYAIFHCSSTQALIFYFPSSFCISVFFLFLHLSSEYPSQLFFEFLNSTQLLIFSCFKSLNNIEIHAHSVSDFFIPFFFFFTFLETRFTVSSCLGQNVLYSLDWARGLKVCTSTPGEITFLGRVDKLTYLYTSVITFKMRILTFFILSFLLFRKRSSNTLLRTLTSK